MRSRVHRTHNIQLANGSVAVAICAGGSVNLLESESAEDCAELVVARAAVFHSFSARGK